VHSVAGTAANVHDLTPVDERLHGNETQVHTDAGYQGIDKREELTHHKVEWQVAMRPGQRRALPDTPMGEIMRKLEQTKARIRAKVEHPFRVIKRQFGYTKVRYRGLAKNTSQLQTLFALSNLWMVRRRLMIAG
jgi:IS5 family transposase